MRFIDARTGQDVEIGDTVYQSDDVFDLDGNLLETRDSSYVLLSSDRSGLFSVCVRLLMLETGQTHDLMLAVRYMHPEFLFQRVAFIPT